MAIFTRPEDISEIDAKGVLEQSVGNHCPFGVPTAVLLPDEFLQFGDMTARIPRFSRKDMTAHMEGVLKAAFNEENGITGPDAEAAIGAFTENSLEILQVIMTTVLDPNFYQSGCVTYPFMTLGGSFAHDTGEDEYADVNASMIFALPERTDGSHYVENNLGLAADQLPEMPGTAEMWKTLLLWHEFSHTTGAAEPQADKMAAVVTKQAFGRNDILQAHADQRMAAMILKYQKQKGGMNIQTEYYGLPLVENLDAVVAMDQDAVDALSVDDIKAMRFETPDYKADKVKAVGDKLSAVFPAQFYNAAEEKAPLSLDDLDAIHEEAKRLVDTGEFDADEDEKYIATRFVTALDRLKVGAPAYRP